MFIITVGCFLLLGLRVSLVRQLDTFTTTCPITLGGVAWWKKAGGRDIEPFVLSEKAGSGRMGRIYL